jgi:ABC-type transporter Mla subunit MlaD
MRRLATIFAMVLAAIAATSVLSSASRGAGSPYQVRAIFDDAAFAVPGEDVRIAGAPVGSIKALDVCAANQAPCPPSSPENKAAVTIEIDNANFTPFYANAHCAIRPQSLIGEKYVDCQPGTSSAAELQKITSGPGTGAYLLPLANTSSPVDSDILQDISQQPIRDRFALILDELGTGLAARGSDLNAVVHRANPALGQTDKVLKILAQQNRVLARLASESDAVLAPLARAKNQLSDFIVQANTTSVASAARAADISRSFQLFPSFLRQLRPLVADLGQLADQGTPLMASLAQSASAVSRQFQNLAPFAKAARPALIDLGNSVQKSQPALLATIPLAQRLDKLGQQAEPTATELDRLTSSLDQTGAIEYLMSLLYYGVGATNTFDSLGHFARTEPMVGGCASYVLQPVPGCSANFGTLGAADVGTRAVAARAVGTRARKATPTAGAAKVQKVAWQAAGAVKPDKLDSLKGLLGYLMGGGK